ncbi:MAG TPA: hypothetical protein VFS67_13700 [Polyangiaceae bacterium]|nr:hypothetical protein [Polyangiaceae bacterium]
MLPPLVVFWLAAPSGTDAHAAVQRWAADHGYRPVAALAAPAPAYDEAVAQEIETLLEDARSLAPGSGGSFERLDQLLSLHPELPQAAWWAAERYALEAQLRGRAGDTDGGPEGELSRRGLALEGPRAPLAGADAAPSGALPPALPLQLRELRPRDELLLDGEPAASGQQIVPGRHQAQLFRAQRQVWSSWVELGSPPVLLVPDTSPACSESDLWGTERGAQGPLPAPGVRCAAWAVANLRNGSELELALCQGSRCGAWERRNLGIGGAPALATEATQPPVPAWVSWGAIGLGAAASTLLVLWQTGVFDRTAPATQFVFTGPTGSALRF